MKSVYLLIAVILAVSTFQGVATQNDDECTIPCPLILLPVCGEDAEGNLRTFSNECLLRYDNCREKTAFVMKTEGECPGAEQ